MICYPLPQLTSIRVACTVIRTDTAPNESFDVNVGLHQMSVLSPLLFSVVMDIDVVSRVKKTDLPSVLYADQLIRMVPRMVGG